VDLGFGKLLEYFREFFGDGATKALILLVTLTFSVFCLNRLYVWAFLPFWQIASDLMAGEKIAAITSSALFASVTAFFIGGVLSYIGGRVVIRLYVVPKMEKTVIKYKESMDEIEGLKEAVDVARLDLFKDIIENGPSERILKFVAEEEERLNKGDN